MIVNLFIEKSFVSGAVIPTTPNMTVSMGENSLTNISAVNQNQHLQIHHVQGTHPVVVNY